MNILPDDKTSYVDAERVARGLAHIAPNQARISFKNAESGARLMGALAQQFKIYQWDDSVSYSKEYDLFFWCCSDCNGRDLKYITLNTDSKKDLDVQIADYERLRAFLSAWESEGDARFTWHTVNDFAATKGMAERILAAIPAGQFVNYHGMKGRVKYSHANGYYFMKAGARKNGYRLDWLKICDIRTLDGKEFAA